MSFEVTIHFYFLETIINRPRLSSQLITSLLRVDFSYRHGLILCCRDLAAVSYPSVSWLLLQALPPPLMGKKNYFPTFFPSLYLPSAVCTAAHKTLADFLCMWCVSFWSVSVTYVDSVSLFTCDARLQ
jgi:hypothetical protein